MTMTSPRTAPLLGLLLLWAAATKVAGQLPYVEVSLSANGFVEGDGVLYFEPYDPPYESMSCRDSTDLGYVCTGFTSLDLSTSASIVLTFDASEDGSKFVAVSGKGGTRAEFRAAAPDCVAPSFQEIGGEEMDVFAEFESVPGEPDVWETFDYNADESFLTLGTEDGSDECELFLRLQFEPKVDGAPMLLAFRSFSVFASYDNGGVVRGPQTYKWGMDGYMWIRRPEEEGEVKLLEYKPETAEEEEASDEDEETYKPSTMPTFEPDEPTPRPTESSRPKPPVLELTASPTRSQEPTPSTYAPTSSDVPIWKPTPPPTKQHRECLGGGGPCDICGYEPDGSVASFCANGGKCISIVEYVGSNIFFKPCDCPVGFGGEHCEVELEIGYEMSTTTRPTEQVGAEDEHMLLLMDGHCGKSFEAAFLKCTPCVAGPLGPQDDPTCADPSHQCFKTQGCQFDLTEFKVELGVTLYTSEGGAAELDGADLSVIANATMHFLNSMGRRHGVLLSSATALYGSATDITDKIRSFELTFLISGYLRSETVTDGFGVKAILSGLIADHPREYLDALVYGAAEAGRDLSFFERVLVRKEDDAIGMEDVPAPPGRPPCRIDCLNGGRCMPAGVDYDYPKADYCNCTTAVVGGNPHAGERCEHPATKSCMTLGSETKHSFCTHGGECVSIVEDHDFHQGCVCPVGWGGAKCELALESIAPTPSHSFILIEEVPYYKSIGVGSCLDGSRNTYSKLIPEEDFESAIACPKVCNEIFGMCMQFEYSSTGKCACLFDRDNAPEAKDNNRYPYSSELGQGRGSVVGTSGNVGVLCYAALEPEQTPAPTVYVPAPAVYDASLDCACGVDWMDAYTNCKPTCTIDKDCLQLGPDYKCQCYTTCQTKVEALPPKTEEVQEEETFDGSGWDDFVPPVFSSLVQEEEEEDPNHLRAVRVHLQRPRDLSPIEGIRRGAR
mmetsp:Transcript_23503/g.53905  ORF Transcript_23503/g.53905 Transcript_23503/m.53905 type:complete len:954 (-) Transcript_23503:313-3174(-)